MFANLRLLTGARYEIGTWISTYEIPGAKVSQIAETPTSAGTTQLSLPVQFCVAPKTVFRLLAAPPYQMFRWPLATLTISFATAVISEVFV